MSFAANMAAAREWSLWLARLAMFTMFGLIPIHFYVPCEVSCRVAGMASLLLFVAGGLSILARRFRPFGWALVAMILHSLSMH